MHDTNGDLRMDTKDLVTSEYGQLDGDPQNNANGFFWAMDNRLYTAGQVDIFLRYNSGSSRREDAAARRMGRHPGRCRAETSETRTPRRVHADLVPTPYFAHTIGPVRTRGSYEALSDEDESLNEVWPVRPNPGTNRAYQAGIDRQDGTLASYTAVCSPLIYRGDRLPSDSVRQPFVAEPAANVVSRIVLSDDGTTLKARKAYDRSGVPASTTNGSARSTVKRARRHDVRRRYLPRAPGAPKLADAVPAQSHRFEAA